MKRHKVALVVVHFLVQCWCCECVPTVKDIDIWDDGQMQGHDIPLGLQMRNSSRDRTAGARVLNFFPVPVEEECKARDGRRRGICMNTYECRMQGGSSSGSCALGFGVCCIFSVTCGQDAYNNITYFVNPNFPDLSKDLTSCSLKVKKIDPEIAQLRLDFVHFNLVSEFASASPREQNRNLTQLQISKGQPNRRTGVCEEDHFVMTGVGMKELTLCGINSGQHVLFDVDNVNDAISISMNLSKRAIGRLWEVRITQVPFAQRAPAGCMQYHTGMKGVIQTMNFADNGRHLANQEYNICMRQEEGICSISYEPCYEDSFKIGSNPSTETQMIFMNPNGTGTGMSSPPSPPGDSEDIGSGDGADAVDGQSRMMEICTDRIVLPCDTEDLLMPGGGGEGFCNLARCGSSLCPMGETPCRVESSATPFIIGVHFGASPREESPEDNLGMCLTYQQLPCMV